MPYSSVVPSCSLQPVPQLSPKSTPPDDLAVIKVTSPRAHQPTRTRYSSDLPLLRPVKSYKGLNLKRGRSDGECSNERRDVLRKRKKHRFRTHEDLGGFFLYCILSK